VNKLTQPDKAGEKMTINGQLGLPLELDDSCSFQNFWVEQENQLAVSTLKKILNPWTVTLTSSLLRPG